MTDKEILAELKRSYEYLYDIRENGCQDHCAGQLNSFLAEQIDDAISRIENVYSTFYDSIDLKDLDTGKEIFGNKIVIARTVSGDYEIYSKDNFVKGNDIDCITCGDLDYKWYEDEDFLLGLEEELEHEVN